MAASLDTSNSMSYSKESVVGGHHTYKAVWTQLIGESIAVNCEVDNAYDSLAVAVYLNDCVVGHLPQFTVIDSAKQLLTINRAISYCLE